MEFSISIESYEDDAKRGQKYEPVMYTRFISIDELLKYSRFTRSELKLLYKGFKEVILILFYLIKI
jgi:hypothetical protein